MTSININRYNS